MNSIAARGCTILILFLLAVTLTAGASAAPPTTRPGAFFVQNVGQFDPAARLQLRAGRQTLWLVDDGLWISLAGEDGRGANVRLTFPDADPGARLEPSGPRQVKVTYGGPDGAFRAVPAWAAVRYRDLYPGLDLELAAADRGWTWKLSGRPRTAATPIRIQVEGAWIEARSADGWRLTTAAGSLQLPLVEGLALDGPGAVGRMPAPEPAGQPAGAAGAPPAAQPSGDGLVFSTYVGDLGWDQGDALAVDAAGNTYVTGYTSSLDFPRRPGPFDGIHGIDVYVLKVNAAGSALDYVLWFYTATLNAEDYGNAIAVDEDGSAYVAGDTRSPDFCSYLGVFPGYDTTYNENGDAFVLKVVPDGTTLAYCTYLGGSDVERANSLALDAGGAAIVAGSTWSADFPVTDAAYDPIYNGNRDVFVARLGAGGLSLDYATFFGGSSQDEATAVAVDGAGRAHVVGWTTSADLDTTPGAFDESFNGGTWDAFALRLDAAGANLGFSTFLGGGEEDRATAVTVDAAGSAVVAGYTKAADFPVSAGAFDADFGGGICDFAPCSDAFVARLTADGDGLTYASYLGDDDEDQAHAVAVDDQDRLYLAGQTRSDHFPVTSGAFSSTLAGDFDAFLTALESSSPALAYSTYVGGTLDDAAYGIALDIQGGVTLTGRSRSADYPTTPGAYSPTANGDHDVVVTRLLPAAPPPVGKTFLPLLLRG